MSITGKSLATSCRWSLTVAKFIMSEIWLHMKRNKTPFILALLIIVILTIVASTVEGTRWLMWIAIVIAIAIAIDIIIIIANILIRD